MKITKLINKKAMELPLTFFIFLALAIITAIILIAFYKYGLFGFKDTTEQTIFSQVGIR